MSAIETQWEAAMFWQHILTTSFETNVLDVHMKAWCKCLHRHLSLVLMPVDQVDFQTPALWGKTLQVNRIKNN